MESIEISSVKVPRANQLIRDLDVKSHDDEDLRPICRSLNSLTSDPDIGYYIIDHEDIDSTSSTAAKIATPVVADNGVVESHA